MTDNYYQNYVPFSFISLDRNGFDDEAGNKNSFYLRWRQKNIKGMKIDKEHKTTLSRKHVFNNRVVLSWNRLTDCVEGAGSATSFRNLKICHIRFWIFKDETFLFIANCYYNCYCSSNWYHVYNSTQTLTTLTFSLLQSHYATYSVCSGTASRFLAYATLNTDNDCLAWKSLKLDPLIRSAAWQRSAEVNTWDMQRALPWTLIISATGWFATYWNLTHYIPNRSRNAGAEGAGRGFRSISK